MHPFEVKNNRNAPLYYGNRQKQAQVNGFREGNSVELRFMRESQARRYYVSGQVQGVGYRLFAQRTARDLGVRGWARNLDDGRVEVLAMGSSRQLEDFEGELRVGPPYAVVRGLATEETGAVHLEGFYIR